MARPYKIIKWNDKETGATGYLVIDKLVNGLCGGGISMHENIDQKEVEDMAKVMSEKFKYTPYPIGGAKSGIKFNSILKEKNAVLRRFLEFIKPFLQKNYVTGADLNTSIQEISSILHEFGIPSPQHSLIKKMSKRKNIPISTLKNNINQGVRHICERKYDLSANNISAGFSTATSAMEVDNKLGTKCQTVAIEGFGDVGSSAALYLSMAGYRIVAISDIKGVIYNKDGLDLDKLLRIRMNGLIFDVAKRKYKKYTYLNNPEKMYSGKIKADIFIPAATRYTIKNTNQVLKLGAKIISSGANCPFSDSKVSVSLAKKGVVVIPDYIANSGTATLYSLLAAADIGPTKKEILSGLRENSLRITSKWIKNNFSPL